eukprot:TRINITY_DN8545_c0_g1_i1.p1 TRINITY_DN8545_c0_g1~~TRINITY_DN8545_c0_g1_i1.p1  ORF type:complete len:112 (-),score=9.80 TRINITY_DN8545_c0_g1_i1:200-535(-)
MALVLGVGVGLFIVAFFIALGIISTAVAFKFQKGGLVLVLSLAILLVLFLMFAFVPKTSTVSPAVQQYVDSQFPARVSIGVLLLIGSILSLVGLLVVEAMHQTFAVPPDNY